MTTANPAASTITVTDKIAADDGGLCPCFSQRAYAECCGSIIAGTRAADAAIEVMRARYSAYVKGAVDYIVSSTHPDRRADCDEKAIALWSANSEWTGFEIVSSDKGGADDDEGDVEFIANFTEERMKKTHHETAAFKRLNGAWYYFDGAIHPPKPFIKPEEDKINRNDPCPCGSGKKFKKCCINNVKEG